MFDETKNEIIKYGKLLGEKNLTAGISGNLSQKCDDYIVITSTNTANGYLKPNDFTVIDFDANHIEGEKKASSEKFLHIEFYKQRPDINSIFHVHSPYLTAFAASSIPLDKAVLPEILFHFEQIPLAKYAIPGSKKLVENTSVYFKDYDVILMQNHGVIVGGKDMKDAFLKLELCETYAKTIICAKILGGAKTLSKDNIKEIYELKKGQ